MSLWLAMCGKEEKKKGKSFLGINRSVLSLVPEPGSEACEGLAWDSLWLHVSRLWPFFCQGRSHTNISGFIIKRFLSEIIAIGDFLGSLEE